MEWGGLGGAGEGGGRGGGRMYTEIMMGNRLTLIK